MSANSSRSSNASSRSCRSSKISTHARLSTVGGFKAGSGRDTFITWNRGGLDRHYHEPGKERHTFDSGLRGGHFNNNNQPSSEIKQRPHSSNPTGRWRPPAPKVYHDNSGRGFGISSIDASAFSVEEMFNQHVEPTLHSTPKQTRALNNNMIRKHIRNVGVPIEQQRLCFLEKCKARSLKANGIEKHTIGRVRVEKKKKSFRNCHG